MREGGEGEREGGEGGRGGREEGRLEIPAGTVMRNVLDFVQLAHFTLLVDSLHEFQHFCRWNEQ